MFPPEARCPQGNNYPYLLIIYLFIYDVSRTTQPAIQIRHPLPCSHESPSGRICSYINPGQVTALQWHYKSRSVGWPDENGGSETVWRCRDTIQRLGTVPKSHGNCHSKESVSGPRRAIPPTQKRHLSSASGTNLLMWGDQTCEEKHNSGSVGKMGTDWLIGESVEFPRLIFYL